MKRNNALAALLAFLTMSLPSGYALAHSGDPDRKNLGDKIDEERHAFGKQGHPGHVVRTITIDMTDAMRFMPDEIIVRQGETIRFVVANKGKMMHEMVIGTLDELKAHGEMMKKHPTMEHDEPYMSHVSPGKKENLVWQFTEAGEFYYACLVPGHFEAGMIGKIKVVKA